MTGIRFFLKRAGYFLYDNRKVVAIVCGLILLCIVIASLSDSCGRPNIEKEQKRIEGLQNTAANINANIANLDQQGAAKEAEVNLRRESWGEAKNATDGARGATDEAVRKAEGVSNANYSNTNLKRAQEARCKALPEDCR